MNPTHAAALSGTHWLVVDDDDFNLELVAGVLADCGVGSVTAPDGRAALAVAEQHAIDGVLMDCQMPVMDGFEAARAMRARPETAELPIIALTGDDTDAGGDRIVAAGMDARLLKPLDPEQMLAVMAELLAGPASHLANAANSVSLESEPSQDEDLFDPQAIVALVGDRPASQLKLLRRYLETSAKDSEAFLAAVASQDGGAARSIAHRLKSSSAAVGACQLAAVARNIEATLLESDDNLMAMADGGAALQACCRQTREHIARQIDLMTSGEGTE